MDDLLHYYPRGYDTFEEPKPMGDLEDGAVMAVDGCLKTALRAIISALHPW